MRTVSEPLRACPPLRKRWSGGFTIVELMTVCAILAILLGISLVVMQKARASAGQVQCLSNLRQIHGAFQLHIQDRGGRFPDPLSIQTTWEAALRPYLAHETVFVCPADQELAPLMGSSYDWRDTGEPFTTLAERSLAEARGDAVLVFDALPGWHRRKTMTAVRVSGAAEVMAEQDCLGDLQASPLAIPESGGGQPR